MFLIMLINTHTKNYQTNSSLIPSDSNLSGKVTDGEYELTE